MLGPLYSPAGRNRGRRIWNVRGRGGRRLLKGESAPDEDWSDDAATQETTVARVCALPSSGPPHGRATCGTSPQCETTGVQFGAWRGPATDLHRGWEDRSLCINGLVPPPPGGRLRQREKPHQHGRQSPGASPHQLQVSTLLDLHRRLRSTWTPTPPGYQEPGRDHPAHDPPLDGHPFTDRIPVSAREDTRRHVRLPPCRHGRERFVRGGGVRRRRYAYQRRVIERDPRPRRTATFAFS
jgi:hypothetical protein